MSKLTDNQYHALQAHQNSLLNRQQPMITQQETKQRSKHMRKEVTTTDTILSPKKDVQKRVRKSIGGYPEDTNHIVSHDYGQPSPRAKLQFFGDYSPDSNNVSVPVDPKSWNKEQGKVKRNEGNWSSDVLGLESTAPSSRNYRNMVTYQQPEAHNLIQMDRALEYKEDRITDKIN